MSFLSLMKKKQKTLKPKVFFNASVILAGLNSPHGGSAKVLNWVKSGRINGLVSEVVIDEALKHAGKIGLSRESLEKKIIDIFPKVEPAPSSVIGEYTKMVIDAGDIHLFMSSKKAKVDYLVSLDKKHVLVLAQKIKEYKIVSPGQLINDLYQR